MAGSAINRTIKQTKAAISICSPNVWPRIATFGRRGFLTYDTRASGTKFNRGAGRTTGGVLHAEDAFAGLSWADAKQLAAPVAFDMCTRDDAEAFVRNRARDVLAGVDNMPWKYGAREAAVHGISSSMRPARAPGRVVCAVWFD